MILSPVPVLQGPHTEFTARVASAPPTPHDTLEAAERKDTRAMLGETGWVLGGPHGAAVWLGMKHSILQFRLRKLGSPASVRDDVLPSRAAPPRTPDPVAVDGLIGINSFIYRGPNASSSALMSSFFICMTACRTLSARTGFGSLSILGKTVGTICHDSPY